MVVLTWCPQPQCHQPSQAPPPALTSQRCLELVPGAALDPSSGLSSTAPRAARGGAEPSGSGWQLAGTEPAGRDREAVARPRCPVPLLPQGTVQPPWGWGDRGGTGLGTSGRYLSGAGARAAAAPDPGAQPGRPRAGSAAVPGPAQRRSGPASAAPPCLENPPPARPWAMQSPQGPCRPLGTSCVPPTSTLPPCQVPSLASEMFISSISARVGALSRTRGRGRASTVLAGGRQSSRQELEARRPEQAWGMQGREL